MRIARSLMAGVLIAGAGIAMAAPGARAETLEQVLASAYATNPSLEAYRARVRATDEGVPQALSGWRPSVTLSSSVTRGRYESNSSSTTQRETNRTGKSNSVTLSQPLYSGGGTVAATDQAEANVLAERANLTSREQTVLVSAATAYLNVVRDESLVKLNVQNEQVLRRQLEAAQERFRVGEITRTDVSQAEARLAEAVAQRVQAEGDLQNSRANFVNVVGRAPEGLEAPKSAVSVPGSFEEVMAQSLAQNPDVVAFDWTAKAAEHAIDVARADLLPTVSLSGEYSRAFNTSANDVEAEALEGGVTLSVPLYEAGSAYSSVRQAKHSFGRSKIEADQKRRDAVETATKTWETLQAARARIRSYASQIKFQEMALAGVEEEAKVGSRTVIDVLNAEFELFNARVNLIKAQREEMVAAFQLRQAMGQATAQALALPVDVYDPTKHYEDVRGKWIGTGIDQEYK